MINPSVKSDTVTYENKNYASVYESLHVLFHFHHLSGCI
ncbi:MAG: hypothetical protein ACI93V_000342 [Alteromonadaceae bacterium]|jgi:hypothetical protein